jgi:DinB superfamily
MSGWGTSTYGDPCRTCGFTWTVSLNEAVVQMAKVPAAYAGLVSGATGHERHPDLTWSVAAYVCHVGDNLRIWSERLMGVALGAPAEVGGYDENELAHARHYEHIPLAAALWSLEVAVEHWVASVAQAQPVGTALIHPQRGVESLLDVAQSNLHDAEHHRWDIAHTLRTVGPAS